MACVNFYYFKTYHIKIDIFIFGLKDDDTATILKIIWSDYPVLWVLLICVFFTYMIFKLSKRILNARFAPKLGIFGTILINVALIFAITMGYITSIVNLPLREHAHHISTNPIANQVAINPIISLGLAYKYYRKLDRFAPLNASDLAQMKDLERELFPIFQHNPQKVIAKNPNVVFVLMESFALNMLTLDDESNIDLLGSFRAHFENGKISLEKRKNKAQNDFTFINFLSSGNGTAPSFSSLFFLSPSPTISLGQFKNHKLPLTPFEIYKKAGYEVIFLTSGNRYWQNLGAYITTLGADEIYDSNFLVQKYPQSVESRSSYGVADEFAYNFALELLQNASKPLFIAILTSSNHKPFVLPKSYSKRHYDIDTALFNHPNQAQIALNLFAYSSNAFGDFVGQIKDSPLKDSVIIAGSGDHRYRDLKSSANLALNYAVPFYLYIPTPYLRDFATRGFDFNPHEIGSHKDIFPTLYAFSLNDYDFLTLGGRNLFDKNAPSHYNFALNAGLFMDSAEIYTENSNIGYKILANDKNLPKILNGFVIQSNETFALPKNKAEFMQKYNKLEWLQINYRIFSKESTDFDKSKK